MVWDTIASLRERILKLLDTDREFRYTVAGRLGILEILERLDKLTEIQTKIWMKIRDIKADIKKIWIEIEEIKGEQTKIWTEIGKIGVEVRGLREDFNKMNARLGRVERTLEKLTIDVEDEARSIIRDRVKRELGIDLTLNSLILPDLELNIYGVSGDLCIVGEATVRGGINLLYELLEKIDLLKKKYPEKLRKKVLPVIYVCLPLPELVEEAKKREIWILKATKDYYKTKIIQPNT
ncbi:MAG TPA: hypothetical protein ENG40_02145 [Thermoprotei archaeon]|nr:hypothetical protein [Thermoprotei archaeon]